MVGRDHAFRFRTALVLSAGLVAALSFGVSPAAAGGHKSKPIVFVHGIDALGTCPSTDGDGTWNDMKRALNRWGWSGGGGNWDVAYYRCDRNYRHWINHHGKHGRHHSSGHVPKDDGTCCAHTQDTSIRHLGYHWAWFLRNHFRRRCVEAVGHSLGGLVVRYALAQVQRNQRHFPRSLCIEDVVTFGTPHGSTPFAFGCGWKQCEQMRPGSDFLDWLRAKAWEPDGRGGTQWTVIGSYDDGWVDEDSAVDMGARHKVKYLGSTDIGHSDYMHRTSKRKTADVLWKSGSNPWRAWYRAPWPVRWAHFALWAGNW